MYVVYLILCTAAYLPYHSPEGLLASGSSESPAPHDDSVTSRDGEQTNESLTTPGSVRCGDVMPSDWLPLLPAVFDTDDARSAGILYRFG